MNSVHAHAMLVTIKFPAAGANMRYEGSHDNQKPVIDRVLAAINVVLILVIIFCANYMVVDFLFQ